jgi:hypothetical protein
VASASGRPLSQNSDAVRKREARQKSSSRTSTAASGRGGAEPSTSKGNPLPPSSPGAKMGEPLSPKEATDQLFYAHVGIAKVIQSEIDLHDLDEEFRVAGENYAYVANHMWTPLRVVIRFVAPIVLLAALLMIWGAMLAATPWMARVRDWWSRRRETEPEMQAVPQVVVDQGGQPHQRPHVVDNESAEPVQPAPPLPRRPAMVRNIRGLHR